MIRNSVPSARPILVAVAAAALLSACGGAQGGAVGGGASQNQVSPLQLQPIGPEPRPFALLTSQVISWRSSSAGTYEVILRPGGDPYATQVLASGNTAAGEVTSVTVSGYELTADAPSTLSFSVRDSAGNFETSAHELELLPVDELPLGSGLHDDLVYDATRDELLVTNRLGGIVQILDVDPISSGYGQQVALLPPGPDAGPFLVTAMPDGSRGFNLYRSTMIEYDLQTLQIESNLPFAGGFQPSGIAVTPDSSRVYIGYYHTLLFFQADPPGNPSQVAGTGITDGLVLGGDVAITPDGKYAFYAWFGTYNQGLWVVDVDPDSDDYNTRVSSQYLDLVPVPDVFEPVTPKVAIAQSGAAAYVGNLSGIAKFDVQAPDFALVEARGDLALTGLTTTSVSGEDRVLVWDTSGRLAVLDADLQVLGEVRLRPLLVERAAVDQEGGRLFLVSQQQQTSGRVLVVPLR